jgi:spermidine/putrescine transport system permease protein
MPAPPARRIAGMAEVRRAKAFSVTALPGFSSIAAGVFVLLYAPIVLLMVYSFNAGQSVAIWEGFSLHWYAKAWQNEEIKNAAYLSLFIAFFAAAFATMLATLAALAMARSGSFRGKTFVYVMINQPLMAPEIVTAVSLLIFFALIKVATGYSGLGYLLLAHTAFCIPFAYLPISGRLQDMDPMLERAAADLYATPWRTFQRVTLPLLWPGVMAGFMLAFVISLDDVVITILIAGPGQETLPVFMVGQLRRSVTPEINAVSTVVLGVSILLVSIFFLLNRERR